MPIYECDICEACPADLQEEWMTGEDHLAYLELVRLFRLLIESRPLRQFLQSMRELRTTIRDQSTHAEEPDEPEESIPYTAIDDPEEPEMEEVEMDDEERVGKLGDESENGLEQPLRT
jgi:hypothetical protein